MCIRVIVKEATSWSGHNAIAKCVVEVILRVCIYVFWVRLTQWDRWQLGDKVSTVIEDDETRFFCVLVYL